MSPRLLPRIGMGGMSIEASAFSPHRSGFEAFRFSRGDDLFGRYEFLRPDSDNFDVELTASAVWKPLVHAGSLPGGMVEPEVYEALKAELLELIAGAGVLDGFFLDIHGAMTVLGRTDAEADLAWAVRRALDEVTEAAGAPRTLISASMDLHGNVTADLVAALDLITCYRMAPHEDESETKARAMRNLVRRINVGADAPARAYVRIPALLPGEKTSTRLDPAKSIYEQVAEVAELDGIVDASLWVGYAWADEPRCYASVVVQGDDAEWAANRAEYLASLFWQARADFEFVAPVAPLPECLDVALAQGAARPFLISDSGDNPTAGGSGDVTWTLNQLLADPRFSHLDGPRTVIASIFDVEAVAACHSAGVGAQVELRAGAQVDHVNSGPAELRGRVLHATAGDDASGRVAVVGIGALEVIITERRKPYHLLSDFDAAGLDVRNADIVVVKIGYLEPELFDLAADWVLALTPGGVDQDLLRLGHKNIDRPMFPFDVDMTAPDLTPQIF